MGQATDAELWRRAVEGEPEAFGVLFERHARTVYNYLFRRTADWALAEDLASIVFLEGWRRRAEVELERDLALPWLLGVATNVLRTAVARSGGIAQRFSACRATVGRASRMTSTSASTTNGGGARS